MSSRQYTVTVKLDDKGVLSKLNQIGSGSPIGGGGKGALSAATGGGGGGGIFGKLESLGVGQLLKLTGIGIGIGALVTATVKSSAQLQGIFKLWETGMMLVFKPFGDFIATLLRPLTIMMLQWAIPFYKESAKFFSAAAAQTTRVFDEQAKDISTAAEDIKNIVFDANTFLTGSSLLIDDTLNQFATDLQTGLTGTATNISDIFTTLKDDIVTKLSTYPQTIYDTFVTFKDDVVTKIVNLPSDIAGVFIKLKDDSWSLLQTIPGLLSTLFTNFGTDIWNSLLNIPSDLLDVFTGLADNITSTLSGIPSAIYNAIMGWISSLTGGAIGGTGPAPSTDSRFSNGNIRSRTNVAGIADTLG